MAVSFVIAAAQVASGVTERTIVIPGSAQDGDLHIAVGTITSEDGEYSTPTGWTVIDTKKSSYATNHTWIGYRIHDPNTANQTLTYSGSAGDFRVSSYVFRGTDSSPFDVTYDYLLHSEEFSNDPTSLDLTIDATTQGAMVVVVQTMVDSTSLVAGESPGYTRSFANATAPQHVMQYKLVNKRGKESPGDWTHTGAAATDDPLNFIFSLSPKRNARGRAKPHIVYVDQPEPKPEPKPEKPMLRYDDKVKELLKRVGK